jgi:23S rRNA-/tRNA-specific pseudouridylate synthase
VRSLSRKYVALLAGAVEADFSSETPIAGKSAKTHFRIHAQTPHATWVEAELETGRTHQIRIHAKAAGHPVLGDRKYGAPHPRQLPKPPRLALHALSIRFVDPSSLLPTEVSAPLPPELTRYWSELESQTRTMC